jgi:hypothetical protein
MVELYLHSPIRLYDVALNYFSTGNILPSHFLLHLDFYTLGTMMFLDWWKAAGA